MFLDCNITF